MVTLSKKEVRKGGKINGGSLSRESTIAGAKSSKTPVQLAADGDQEDDSDDFEDIEDIEDIEDDTEAEVDDDNDSERDGSASGMKRLMELVGEEDLNDFERAQLALDEGSDEDDDEVEDEDAEEPGAGTQLEGIDEDGDDEEDEGGSVEAEIMDEVSTTQFPYSFQLRQASKPKRVAFDESAAFSEADSDAVPLDDMGSDVSVDEDAVPKRKVTANNKVCTSPTLFNLQLIEDRCVACNENTDRRRKGDSSAMVGASRLFQQGRDRSRPSGWYAVLSSLLCMRLR